MKKTFIKNWDYLREYKRIRKEVLKGIDMVFSSGQLILGERVRNFEIAFSKYCGGRFGVGVNSGTDALIIGLKALGITAGDEVITVSNTAVPTVAAIRTTGAMPMFVDIKEDTYLMDVAHIEEKITKKTKCILPVHLYGHPVDMTSLMQVARRYDLSVLEDCAQSHGTKYHNKMTGNIGDIGAFSFYPTKVLGTYGDGGMVVTNNKRLAEKARMMRMYGMRTSYYSEMEGINSRLDELHAALLHLKLKHLDEYIRRRINIANYYISHLKDFDIILPQTKKGCTHTYYLFVIRLKKRDELLEYLKKKGIETRIHFPIPIHLMRGYRFLEYKKGTLPITERVSKEILSLPMHPYLKEEELEKVVKSIRAFFE
jgi:dTDP-4-amino-4,6-dideoxygalactose transaminase